MSDKRTCPSCDSYTSSVFAAFRDGEPCPYCGLPAEVADAVEVARERHVNDEVIAKMVAAEQRAQKAEEEARTLRLKLAAVRRALDWDPS